MKTKKSYKWLSMLLALLLMMNIIPMSAFAQSNTQPYTTGMENATADLDLTKISGYSSGMTDADGGVMEIVAYNSANGFAYSVNGKSGKLVAISLGGITKTLTGTEIDIERTVNETGFTYGDMTSVAVSPDGSKLAIAIQSEGYSDNGRIAIFKCNSDGTLTLKSLIEVGVQPDMVTFTPDGTKILSANEGEPRKGYGSETVDPKGSVSIIDVGYASVTTVGFDAFDARRDTLVADGIVIKKDTAPSVDFEPEYIACTDTTAYVSLQEANAIAVLDLENSAFTGIYSCGFEDYSTVVVDIDKGDEAYNPTTYGGVYGIRMPDGISLYTVDGTDYILTANEGDSREWGNYCNENEVKKNKQSPEGNIPADTISGKVVYFDTTDYDGLVDGNDYLFGGRSFTMFKVTDTGLEEVFDSGDDFESKINEYFPDYFNCSNDDLTIDDRSGKKGPEPETVTVGNVNGKVYAFVSLERIGGIMVYDITDPDYTEYVNYINSRDFSDDVAADDSPEGLCFISAENSPTGEALLLAACEVGGTVAVYEVIREVKPYNITVAPGSDLATSLGFNWYSEELTATEGRAQLQYRIGDGDIITVDADSSIDERTGTGSASSAGGPGGVPGGPMPFSPDGDSDIANYISHKVTLTDLAPGTAYTYRVKALCNEWSEWYTVKTATGNDDMNFLYMSDAQIGAGKNIEDDIAGWTATLEAAIATVPDAAFAIHAGDQIDDYSANSEEYDGYLEPETLRDLVLATVTGNHEVERNAAEAAKDAYISHFNIPNLSGNAAEAETDTDILNYWFRAGSVVMVVLDNSGSASEAVAATFQAKIQEAKTANPDAEWLMVSFHKSLYSVASHTPLETDIANWRNVMLPILEAEDVDVVLGGHDHIYVRTYPMEGGVATTKENAESGGTLVDADGVVHLTSSSASGSKFYQALSGRNAITEEAAGEFAATYQTENDTPSFVKISVTDNMVTFTDYEVEDDGSVTVFDTYTLSKTSAHTHTYENDCDTTCDGCAHVREVTHKYNALKNNNTEHWYECSVCGVEETGSREEHKDGGATCTNAAECSVCGEKYGDILVHDYVNLRHDKTEHWYECSVCGEEKAGSRAEHSGGTATCTAKAKCEVCSAEYGKANGHGETEVRNTKAATCTEEGYTGDEHCKVCDEKLEDGTALAKTAHTYENGKCTVCDATDPNYASDSPQTGDNSNMALWLALLFVSGMGVVSTIVYGKRKRRTR